MLIFFQRPDDYRRKWDRDEYEKLARERLDEDEDDEDLDLDWKSKDKQPPIRREFLKPRDYRVIYDFSTYLTLNLTQDFSIVNRPILLLLLQISYNGAKSFCVSAIPISLSHSVSTIKFKKF